MNEQDDTTSNTFDAEFLSESADALWDPQLTQQLRVLLHADRLLSLQSRDEHRPPEFQHYASLSLALKLFDLIITNMGLGQDIEHSQAIEELLPLLEAMDRGAGREPERARAVSMAERVLAALYNEKEQRGPFQLDYTTFEQGKAIRRTLSVRLLDVICQWFCPQETRYDSKMGRTHYGSCPLSGRTARLLCCVLVDGDIVSSKRMFSRKRSS